MRIDLFLANPPSLCSIDLPNCAQIVLGQPITIAEHNVLKMICSFPDRGGRSVIIPDF